MLEVAQDYHARRGCEEAPNGRECLPIKDIRDDGSNKNDRPERRDGTGRRYQRRQTGRGEISNSQRVRMTLFRYVYNVAVQNDRPVGL